MSKYNLEIIHENDELRELIINNPNLPIIIRIAEDATTEWAYTYSGNVSFCIGEILDYELPFDNERVFDDRIELEERVIDYFYGREKRAEYTDEEIDKQIDDYLKQLSQCWIKAIVIDVR